MSYGLGPLGYGIDPYGAPVLGVSLASATAQTTHEVRVTLSAEPRHSSQSADGDALNPLTWTVRRLDSGVEFTIIGVGMATPTTVAILTYEALGPFTVQHSVFSDSLLSFSGQVITTPETAVFRGVVDRGLATPTAQAATRNFGQRDIANPSTSPTSVGGTLVVGPGGDYRNEGGAALLEKLFLRRLTTRKRQIWYLPDYGLGIAEKEPIPGSLVPLQSDVERQLSEEPDAANVRARVTLDALGVLTIAVSATLRQTGQQVKVSYATTVGRR